MKTTEETTIRRPEFRDGHPVWFHHHGRKMQVEKANSNSITIAAPAAEFTIVSINGNAPNTTDFYVAWKVLSTRGEMNSGNRYFSDEELAAAFSITDDSGDYGQWLIDRYGGLSAQQGKYIRLGNFLNIPCPGTGMDGDPNISVFITDEIRDAIRFLLNVAATRNIS